MKIRYKLLGGSPTTTQPATLPATSPAQWSGDFVSLPAEVTCYVIDKHRETYAAAKEKGLFANSQVHCVNDKMEHRAGGLVTFENTSDKPMASEIPLIVFDTKDIHFEDVSVGTPKIRWVDRGPGTRYGRLQAFWTPDKPIPPGAFHVFCWTYTQAKSLEHSLPPATSAAQPEVLASLKMANFPGPQALEDFFLVVPKGMKVANASSKWKTMEEMSGFVVYHWQDEVRANTNHEVSVTLQIVPGSATQPAAQPSIVGAWKVRNASRGLEFEGTQMEFSGDGRCIRTIPGHEFDVLDYTVQGERIEVRPHGAGRDRMEALGIVKLTTDTLVLSEGKKLVTWDRVPATQAAKIAAGMVVLTLQLGPQTDSKIVHPEDHIDLIGEFAGDGRKATRTIIAGVHVLEVSGKPNDTGVRVSIEVSPQVAKELSNVLSHAGSINAVVRNPSEGFPKTPPGPQISDDVRMFAGAPVAPASGPAASSPTTGGPATQPTSSPSPSARSKSSGQSTQPATGAAA